jgi:hypothetical protein
MAETFSIYIIDISGSMSRVADEVSGEINAGLQGQRGEDIHLDVVEFNTRLHPWYNGPVNNVPTYSMRTGYMTALLDAVGETIDRVGRQLAEMDASERPRLVTVTIVTDGLENASRKYTKAKVAEMIRHQSDVYNWQFFYIGANQDAYQVARDLGINEDTTSNAHQTKIGEGYKLTMNKVADMTRASKRGVSVEVLEGMAMYSESERKSLE